MAYGPNRDYRQEIDAAKDDVEHLRGIVQQLRREMEDAPLGKKFDIAADLKDAKRDLEDQLQTLRELRNEASLGTQIEQEKAKAAREASKAARDAARQAAADAKLAAQEEKQAAADAAEFQKNLIRQMVEASKRRTKDDATDRKREAQQAAADAKQKAADDKEAAKRAAHVAENERKRIAAPVAAFAGASNYIPPQQQRPLSDAEYTRQRVGLFRQSEQEKENAAKASDPAMKGLAERQVVLLGQMIARLDKQQQESRAQWARGVADADYRERKQRAFVQTMGFAGSVAAAGTGIIGATTRNLPNTSATVSHHAGMLLGEIGLAFLPELMSAARTMRDLRTWVQELDPAVKSSAASLIFWGTAAATGVYLGGRLVSMVNSTVKAFSGMEGAVGKGVAGLARFAAAHPVGLVAVGAAAVVAGIGFMQMADQAARAAEATQRMGQQVQLLERLRSGGPISGSDVRPNIPGTLLTEIQRAGEADAPWIARSNRADRPRIRQMTPEQRRAYRVGEMAEEAEAEQGRLSRGHAETHTQVQTELERLQGQNDILGLSANNNRIAALTALVSSSPAMRRNLGIAPDASQSDIGARVVVVARAVTGNVFPMAGANLSREHIQGIATQLAGAPQLVDTRTRAELLRRIQREGLPDLMPGSGQTGTNANRRPLAVDTGFQSSQIAIESFHDVIQRDAVRDSAQQERFELMIRELAEVRRQSEIANSWHERILQFFGRAPQ